jgi:hypothetical protein
MRQGGFMSRLFELLLACALLALSACSLERFSQNVYEGSQSHAQTLKTPQEKASEPPPQDYRDYQRERERLKSPVSAQ